MTTQMEPRSDMRSRRRAAQLQANAVGAVDDRCRAGLYPYPVPLFEHRALFDRLEVEARARRVVNR